LERFERKRTIPKIAIDFARDHAQNQSAPAFFCAPNRRASIWTRKGAGHANSFHEKVSNAP
jgi:hypothetical protein